MSAENEIYALTTKINEVCGGHNVAVVVGSNMSMIQTCVNYATPQFKRATAEALLRMANDMLKSVGAPTH